MWRSTTKALYIDDSNIPGEQYLQTVSLQSDTNFVMTNGLFGDMNSLLSYYGRILFGARGYSDYTIMIGSDFVQAPNLTANNLIVQNYAVNYFSITGLQYSGSALEYSYNGTPSLAFGNNAIFYQPTTFLNNVTFNGPTSFGNILANGSNISAGNIECSEFDANSINSDNANINDVIANTINVYSLDILESAYVGVANIGNLYANALHSNSIVTCNIVGNYGNIFGNLQGNVISANNAFTNDCFLGNFAEINLSSFYYGIPVSFENLTANYVFGDNIVSQTIGVENVQGNLFLLEGNAGLMGVSLVLNGPSYGNCWANVFYANSVISNSVIITGNVESNICDLIVIDAIDTITGNVSFGNGYVAQANITNLIVGNANCLVSSSGNEANIGSLTANFGFSNDIVALFANSGNIQANTVFANIINVSSTITSNNINSNTVTSNIVVANVANIGYIYSNVAQISNLNATQANVQDIIILGSISAYEASFVNCHVLTSINGNVLENGSLFCANSVFNNVIAQIANITVLENNSMSSNTTNANVMGSQTFTSQYFSANVLNSGSINCTTIAINNELVSNSIQTYVSDITVLQSAYANIGVENCQNLFSNDYMFSPYVGFNTLTSQTFIGNSLLSNLICGNIYGNSLFSNSIDANYLNVENVIGNASIDNCFIGNAIYGNAITYTFNFTNNVHIDFLYSTTIDCNTCQLENYTGDYLSAQTIRVSGEWANIGLGQTDNILSNSITVINNATIANVVANLANVNYADVEGNTLVGNANINNVSCSIYFGNAVTSNIATVANTTANVFNTNDFYCSTCNSNTFSIGNLTMNTELTVPLIMGSCNITAFGVQSTGITSLHDIVVETDNLNYPIINATQNIQASSLTVLNDLTFPSLNTYYLNVTNLVDAEGRMTTTGNLSAGTIRCNQINSDYVTTQSLTVTDGATFLQNVSASGLSATTINSRSLSTSTFYAPPIIFGGVVSEDSSTISGPLTVSGISNLPGTVGITDALTVIGETSSQSVSATYAGFSGNMTANYVNDCTTLYTSSLATSLVVGQNSINLGKAVSINDVGIACVDAVLNGCSFVQFYNGLPEQSYIATCIQQAIQQYNVSTSAITANFSDLVEASNSLLIPVFYESITTMQQQINSINAALKKLNTFQFECLVKPSASTNMSIYVIGNSVSMYNGNTLPFTSLL